MRLFRIITINFSIRKGEFDMSVDYNVLESNIIKSCRSEYGSVHFLVSYDKLKSLCDDIGLTVVNTNLKSEMMKPEIVPYIQEYFKGKRLSWMSDSKSVATLVFIPTDAVDENCQALLRDMESCRTDDPDLDKVKSLATIAAEYPCYFATVVSYISNDIKRNGKATYAIKCRANTVALRQDNYEYNHNDI